MTTEQLVIDPEVIRPLADRVCLRVRRAIEIPQLRCVVPDTMIGPRLTIAHCSPEEAGRILVRLMEGQRRGLIEVTDGHTVIVFAWFVRDPDTAPMVDSKLTIGVVPSDDVDVDDAGSALQGLN